MNRQRDVNRQGTLPLLNGHQPRAMLFYFLVMAFLAMSILVSGCAHAPDTVTLKTPQGSERVKTPSVATLFSIARIFAAKQQYAESERVLRQLLATNEDFIPAYNELAEILVLQHRHEDAFAVTQAGLQEAPGDPVLCNNAGMCQLLLKNYGAATEHFAKACAASPENARYLGNLALSLALQGKTREAQAYYENILPPEDAAKNLEIIARTRLAEIQARPEAAAGALSK